MDLWEREHLTNRIISGAFYCVVDGTVFFVKSPSPEIKYRADIIYQQTYHKARAAGSYDDKEFELFLINRGLWTKDEDSKMKTLEDDIEKLKVFIYENYSKKEKLGQLRKGIIMVRETHRQLLMKKLSHSHVTCRGLAFAAKYKYQIGFSLHEGGKPYWTEEDGWDKSDGLLDRIVNEVRRNEIDDTQIRELARTDPWRSIWLARNHAGRGLFDKAAVELTSDQNRLTLYSTMYDSIYEHPDKPSDEIINDDDAIDGWKIVQKKKVAGETARQEIDRRIGKIKKGANEVYVMLTEEDGPDIVGDINDCNSPGARFEKLRRENQIKQEGRVEEINFADNQIRLREQQRQQSLSESRGK